MTVQDLIEKLDLSVLVEGELDREITDCYIGDLLSWVMGRAPADSAWLTVMGNINSIAVGGYPRRDDSANRSKQLPVGGKNKRAFVR